MIALAQDHLDDLALAALALGDLPPSFGADARSHLHACAACAGRFVLVAHEADRSADQGDQALLFEAAAARASAIQLLEVARPDGGAVLLFPARAAEGVSREPSGVARLASRVFGRFGQLLHAAAGVPEREGGLEVASGDEVHSLAGAPGDTLEVWFGNPHPHLAWLTVLRQQAGSALPPSVCDGPRALSAGRNAGDPTRLSVSGAEEVVLAVLTREEPPARERLQEALSLGLFGVFDAHGPLGQVVCRVTPRA